MVGRFRFIVCAMYKVRWVRFALKNIIVKVHNVYTGILQVCLVKSLDGFFSEEQSCEDANVLCANVWVGFVAPNAFVSWEVSQRCNPL